jgi:hypothetical protein
LPAERVKLEVTGPAHGLAGAHLQAVFGVGRHAEVPGRLPIGAGGRAVQVLPGWQSWTTCAWARPPGKPASTASETSRVQPV